MNLLRRFLGKYVAPNSVFVVPGQLPARPIVTLSTARKRMTAIGSCPPGMIPQWLNGKFLGCSKPTGTGAPAGMGAVDMTNQAVIDAANTLHNDLQVNGCQPVYVQSVKDFQVAYVNAGGVLPLDSGGRNPEDGLYGNNTSAALKEFYSDAPAGCVGAASGGAAPGGGGLTTAPTSTSATLFSSLFDGSSSFFGLASGWWIVGAVALAGLAVIANPKPGSTTVFFSKKARKRRKGKRKSKRAKRSARRGKKRSSRRSKKKSKRRRNPLGSKKKFAVGDVYAGTWGFNESHPAFFEITRLTSKTVFGRFLVDKPSGEFHVMPTSEHHGKERRATPTASGLKIGHIYVFPWNGKPQYKTPVGMGNETPQTKYQRSRAAKLGHWAKKQKKLETLRRQGYSRAQAEKIIKRGY